MNPHPLEPLLVLTSMLILLLVQALASVAVRGQASYSRAPNGFSLYAPLAGSEPAGHEPSQLFASALARHNVTTAATTTTTQVPPFQLSLESLDSTGKRTTQQQQQHHSQVHQPNHQLAAANQQHSSSASPATRRQSAGCPVGLLTFELATGFIYRPAAATETLAMMPSTLQLTDCLEFCIHNASCQAINFEMGLCVLLASSAKHNPLNLYASQFPVFTIYAEKKCLLAGDEALAERQRRRCPRAWTFERVAGFEMKTRPRRRLKLASKELCMEACLGERDFECRSANWHRLALECTLSDQDRHSVSQSEAGDQQLAAGLRKLYGPAGNATVRAGRRLEAEVAHLGAISGAPADQWPAHHYEELPASVQVDYLENNCVFEPNKLCEFRKIQNRVLKTVDSIYQDVASLEECKHKCLNAPYRCYSFDYGDTSERVCRTSHLDQASLLSVQEPYLDVVGAITYELAACFNVSIECRAREMLARVSSSKVFRGRIYAKARPASCLNDVRESLHFELRLPYHDEACAVRASSNQQQGVFSSDIVIQHHDRIVTTQDVGLSVFCQYDLANRSVATNSVDLAVEQLERAPPASQPLMEGKQPATSSSLASPGATLADAQAPHQQHAGAGSWPMTITSLATTVVRSPNVTMRITNMNGQPVQSATVGDRLALMFEIKEKTSPFSIFVREIMALDGKQLLAAAASAKSKQQAARPAHHPHNHNHHLQNQPTEDLWATGNASRAQPQDQEQLLDSLVQANRAGSVMLIDSAGCPTDANIMGPLVRLDAAGRRVLAPFDAFKFPGSDMVFFRAIVSSCISDCRPVSCASSQQQILFASSSAPASANGLDSTRAQPSTYSLSLNEAATASLDAQEPESARTSPAPSTPLPTSVAAEARAETPSTGAPSLAELADADELAGAPLVSTTTSSAATLTATATATASAATTEAPPTPAMTLVNSNQHQAGRTAGPRPLTRAPPVAAPIPPLDGPATGASEQDAAELLRKFEQRLKLKQQLAAGQTSGSSVAGANASAPASADLADIYSGLLSSMIGRLAGDAPNNHTGAADSAAPEHVQGRNSQMAPVKEASGSASRRKAELDALLSLLLAAGWRAATGNRTARHLATASGPASAPEAAAPVRRASARVEMYAVPRRHRRSAQHHDRDQFDQDPAQAYYDTGELVVQSIKIRDRLDFPQPEPRSRAAHDDRAPNSLDDSSGDVDEAQEERQTRATEHGSSLLSALVALSCGLLLAQLFMLILWLCLAHWRRRQLARAPNRKPIAQVSPHHILAVAPEQRAHWHQAPRDWRWRA